jgi:branched-chain amino acid transport system ATP-binding protein
MTDLLHLEDVHTFIDRNHILEGVNMMVPQGEVVALLGRNGAGKTTTLRTIIGLLAPRSGSIRYRGEEIGGRDSFEIARSGIGYVPEHRAIFADLTVEENLRLAERKKGDLRRKADLIYRLFPDLDRLGGLPGSKLSGGQQQMLAVARALVPDNDLLLIDEPSEGLAPILVEQMIEAIKRLEGDLTVVLVEQNLAVASHLATKYVIIEEGRSVAGGQMADLIEDTETVRRYLGVA